MTLKELLGACDPHVKVKLYWQGYEEEPTVVTDAWDAMFYASEHPEETVRNIEVHEDVLDIKLFRKKVKK